MRSLADVVFGGAAMLTGFMLCRLFCRLDSVRFPVKTYGDLAERVIGVWARHACSILQSIQLIINVGIICLVSAVPSPLRRFPRSDSRFSVERSISRPDHQWEIVLYHLHRHLGVPRNGRRTDQVAQQLLHPRQLECLA